MIRKISLSFVLIVSFLGSYSFAETRDHYIGSKECASCHRLHYEGWKSTLHTKMEQPVIVEGPEKTVKGDFSSNAPALTFKVEDVDMVVGSRFKQRYAKKIADDYYMLPAQWKVQTRKWAKYMPKKDWWVPYYPEEWNKRPTSKLCEGCHTVGFNIETKEPAERNIGCEACHGPGEKHAKAPGRRNIVNPSRLSFDRSMDICFQCHLSGKAPGIEYAWPLGYKPGDDLSKYWEESEYEIGKATYELWPNGAAHKNRVQGNTFKQSRMYKKGIKCVACHNSHGTDYISFTYKPDNALCLTCHGPRTLVGPFYGELKEHTHHHNFSNGSSCIECHMPKTGKNAVEWDSRNHTFEFIYPKETLKYGPPNACVNCHKEKDNIWAANEMDKWKLSR